MDAVNGENFEMANIFYELNCDFGLAISQYLKAKYLYKMKKKTDFEKA
jgi:hypothetical protein